jgi:hypothetical protein
MGQTSFKTVLISLLSGDHYDLIVAYPHASLPELAKLLAERFITSTKFNDAVTDLDHFKREATEPIRTAMARLRASIDKASLVWPLDEREIIKNVELRKTLRIIISEKARHLIDKQSLEARQQGINLSIDRMIRIAEDEEKRTGKHGSTISTPVSIFHAETASPAVNSITTKIDALTDAVTKLVTHASKVPKRSDTPYPTKAEINAAGLTGSRDPSQRRERSRSAARGSQRASRSSSLNRARDLSSVDTPAKSASTTFAPASGSTHKPSTGSSSSQSGNHDFIRELQREILALQKQRKDSQPSTNSSYDKKPNAANRPSRYMHDAPTKSSSNPRSRSASQSRYNNAQTAKPASNSRSGSASRNSPFIQANNSTLNIAPCRYCASTIPHPLSKCYSVQILMDQINQEN